MVDPGGPWADVAAATVTDWLTLFEEVAEPGDVGDTVAGTLMPAVLRGALLDALATGDVERTSAAVRRHLEVTASGDSDGRAR